MKSKKKRDCNVIYNLMLKQLKAKLESEDCKDTTLRIALEFVKTYDLDEEVKFLKEDKSIDDIIQKLPFTSE